MTQPGVRPLTAEERAQTHRELTEEEWGPIVTLLFGVGSQAKIMLGRLTYTIVRLVVTSPMFREAVVRILDEERPKRTRTRAAAEPAVSEPEASPRAQRRSGRTRRTRARAEEHEAPEGEARVEAAVTGTGGRARDVVREPARRGRRTTRTAATGGAGAGQPDLSALTKFRST